jgi:hypothetical protein
VLAAAAGDRRDAKLLAAGYAKIAVANAVTGEPATSIFRRDP